MKTLATNLILITTMALLLSSCCSRPWKKYPGYPAPDISYRTGHTHGYDVYIWKCAKDRRIVIYAYTAEMSCKEPQRITGPCGIKTAFEKKIANMYRRPVPKVRAWPRTQ